MCVCVTQSLASAMYRYSYASVSQIALTISMSITLNACISYIPILMGCARMSHKEGFASLTSVPSPLLPAISHHRA